MSELSHKINFLLRALDKASAEINSKSVSKISAGDIESALVDVLGIDEPMDLLELEITAEFIVDQLEGYEYAKLHPEEMGHINLEPPPKSRL